MIKSIKRFFGLCEHEWKIIERIDVYDYKYCTNTPIGTDYILTCKKCGNIKVKKVR